MDIADNSHSISEHFVKRTNPPLPEGGSFHHVTNTTAPLECLNALSRAVIAPLIRSVLFSLSGLILPAGSVLIKMLSIIQRRTG